MNNPFDRTVLLSITVKMLGVSRTVNNSSIEVDADKDLLRVSKRIIECPEFASIQRQVSALKKYLKGQCVPGVKFIKSGIYPIPTAQVETIDAKVREFISTYEGSVARFLEVYEARAEEGRKRLNVLGEVTDYPKVDIVKKAFGIDTEYITLGPPRSLQEVSQQIWERESQKIQQSCQEAATQVQDAMRQAFAELVSHMVDRLKPDATGKKKVFKDSMIVNFKEFIESFKDRNITDDADLAKLVEQTQIILAGKSIDSLRKNADLRAVVADSMAAVKTSLDSMLKEMPSRSIMIEDEEPSEVTESPVTIETLEPAMA